MSHWKRPAGLAILSAHHGHLSFPLLVLTPAQPQPLGVWEATDKEVSPSARWGTGGFSNLFLYVEVSDSILKESCEAHSDPGGLRV